MKGGELKDWLEWCGGQFNEIVLGKGGEQELMNMELARYKFEVIDGVRYEIDVREGGK
ncbi:hypothetical protein [Paenibacillus xylanexedens]|uniref:hypothetical protein n=1 Tax=Paenibacillus xylanexedens TaxID=528191 RepID=UPI00119F33A5